MGPRAHLPADDGGAARRTRYPADGAAQHRALRHRVLRVDRGQGGDQHRDFRRRSRRDGSRGDRSAHPSRRSGAAGAHVSAEGAHRRRARAGGTDGGGRRSVADRGAVSGRRDLRNHERGRQHGPGAGTGEVRETAQAADDHDRGSDPVPHAHRIGRPPRGVGRAPDRTRRFPGDSRSKASSIARRTSRWSRATSPGERT